MTDPVGSDRSPHVAVRPEVFAFVHYDANEIARLTAELAGWLGVGNPIVVDIDETTPNAKLSVAVDGASSDALVTIRAESGALEDTKRLTTFGRRQASVSLGRMLLRARDRMRSDFATAPGDLELSWRQNAAWDAYCAGRLDRLDVKVIKQRFRYNFRNRFGFTDEVDAVFERLWNADDLSWSAIDDPI